VLKPVSGSQSFPLRVCGLGNKDRPDAKESNWIAAPPVETRREGERKRGEELHATERLRPERESKVAWAQKSFSFSAKHNHTAAPPRSSLPTSLVFPFLHP
jgi:hypothetical protein